MRLTAWKEPLTIAVVDFLSRIGCIAQRDLSEIGSMHTSANLGPDREETAPSWLTCIGVATKVSERIFFEIENGPPYRS